MSSIGSRLFSSNFKQRANAFAGHQALKGNIKSAVLAWRMLDAIEAETNLIPIARSMEVNGNPNGAFDLLLAASRGRGQIAGTAAKEYQILSTWLGDAGFIAEAEGRIRDFGAIPGRAQSAQNWLISFWYRRSILDPANVGALLMTIESEPASEMARKAFWLIYMIEGASDRLLRLYEKALEKPTWPLLGDFLAITATDRTDLFREALSKSKYRKLFQPTATSLAIDLALAHSTDSKHAGLVPERQLTFARRLQETDAHIWNRISDPNLSVAVVGNSPCEAGRGMGAEIDAHDIVIRFNRPAVAEEHQADYGSRTDILVANHDLLPRLDATLSLPIIVTGKGWEVVTRFKGVAMRLSEQGVALGIIPRDVRTKLNRALMATSSSGSQTLAAVCSVRGGSKNVGIYGFSLVDQIGESPTSANYFRSSRPSANHNWRGEAALLAGLRRNQALETILPELGAERYKNNWRTLENFKPTRFRIEGDHSHYHCGSAAVMRSLRHFLQPSGVIVEDGAEYDVMIVNGEGTMHHGGKGFHRKMGILRNSLDAGKAAYLVNTLWYDNPHDHDDVLKRLNGLHVREVMSQQELLHKHGVSSKLVPDIAYYAPLKPPVHPVDYKGGIVMTDFFSKEYDAFVKLTRAEALKYPYVDMMGSSWDDLIASLKTAELLITGRHHGVFAACRAEIPFVVFGGNTHKIEGIFRSAGVVIPFCESRADMINKIRWARSNPQEFQKLFNWLKRQKAWQL